MVPVGLRMRLRERAVASPRAETRANLATVS